MPADGIQTAGLGLGPLPQKEGMPYRLLMPHGKESGRESTLPACMKPHLPLSTPCQDQWVAHEVHAPRGNPNPSHHLS